MARQRVVIVGGGISGLATAWRLRDGFDVTILEADHRVGGKIATTQFRDRPLDLGADAFIVRNRAAVDLCHELGIDDQLIEPSTRRAAIYARGRLRPFPEALVLGVPTDLRALLRSRVVGTGAALRTARDRFARSPVVSRSLLDDIEQGVKDPTVAEIFTRRLGRRVVEALIDPLVGGINAGDVRELSFAAAMPQVLERITNQPSVMRALAASALGAATETGGHSIFRGLRGGMSVLVDSLATNLEHNGVEIVRNARVREVTRTEDGKFAVSTSSNLWRADALVLATPAFVSATLLGQMSPPLAQKLTEIPYASVATVTFAFAVDAIPKSIAQDLHDLDDSASRDGNGSGRLLPGSGALIARNGAWMTTATSFTSSKWPRSAPDGEVIIRASLGRHGDERPATLDDDSLVRQVESEIASILGITAAPLDVRVQRWPTSFPQYVSGHAARVKHIDALANELGLELVGAAYHGIGIPSCIVQADRSAARLRARLEIPDPKTRR